MSDDRGRAHRTFSHAELDCHVASLYSVGGIYECVAQIVERNERPRCTGAPTAKPTPWSAA